MPTTQAILAKETYNDQIVRLFLLGAAVWGIAGMSIGVYAAAGFFVGVAGILQFSKLNSGDPTGGGGMELRIIAAVVVGGASLNGGRGSVLGTIAGAAVMGVITTGCSFLQIDSWIQDIVIGSIIVAAAAFDQFRQRKLAA